MKIRNIILKNRMFLRLQPGLVPNTVSLSFYLFLSIFSFCCRKAVQVDPPNSGLISSTVFDSNTTAAAAVTSIYDRMINSSGGLASGASSISLSIGLSSDELKNYSTNTTLSRLYSNTLNSTVSLFWNEIYQEIYVANVAIEGLDASTKISVAVKKQLMGEAKFMRAFLHFYAVNLYGDVPLVTTTDYRINNVSRRTPTALVYQQIISDLKDAQANLSDNYLTPANATTTERVRPNRAAATALLARTYLYTGKYDSAEAQATAIINDSVRYSLVQNKDSVFLMNSHEAIWQLQPVSPGWNTWDAQYFVLTSAPGTGKFTVALSDIFLNAIEPNDGRLNNWVRQFSGTSQIYNYPFKYKVNLQGKPLTEYLMVLRLAEQFLIRAEARAQQGNTSGAQNDLNVIRSRAGLPNTTANDPTSLLSATLHERQIELFTEWGHRWFDLKRTGTVNDIMKVVTPLKGGVWNSDWALLPIPQSEILLNSNLTQNHGYN